MAKMNPDELESLSREIEKRFSNGFITSKQARGEILTMLKELRSKTRKEDALIARNISDQVWKRVVKIDEIEQAILKKDEEEANGQR